MSSLVTDKPVLVTGAGGWVASHTIYQLLEKGYKVRGTVRDVNGKKYAFLKTLEFHSRSPELLTLVNADLLSPEGWKEAVQGCEYVLHLASPFTFKYKDQQKELIEPAVNGVANVLAACCQENSGVKRVVVTSSVCSVVFGHSATRYECNKGVLETAKTVFNEQCAANRYSITGKSNLQKSSDDEPSASIQPKMVDNSATEPDPFAHLRTSMATPEEWAGWKLMNPSDWSVPETIKGYELSKVLAEKKAWELIKAHNASAKSNKIDIVALCPGFVFGPIMNEAHAVGESTSHILRLINRTYPFVPAINSAHVDVRDAAACHILAMEREAAANKRYMVTCDDGNLTFAEQAELLRRNLKEHGFSIPTAQAPRLLTQFGGFFSTSISTAADKLDSITYATNKQTHEELGMTEWRTVEGALYAHAVSLMKYGVVNRRKFPEELLSRFKAY